MNGRRWSVGLTCSVKQERQRKDQRKGSLHAEPKASVLMGSILYLNEEGMMPGYKNMHRRRKRKERKGLLKFGIEHDSLSESICFVFLLSHSYEQDLFPQAFFLLSELRISYWIA